MIGALLSALLCATPPASDPPNIFQPQELSSEVISVAVEVCIGQQAPKTKEERAEAFRLCACVVDAVRLNTSNGKRPPDNSATALQVSMCRDAQEVRHKAEKRKSGI